MKRTNKLEKGVTLIAANTRIKGDVEFSDQLFVNGSITGNVSAVEGSDATLVVSEEGKVTGDVRVPNVVVNGTIEGNVFAGERAELAARARVSGNVHYKLIEMQLGALIDGQLLHQNDASAKVHTLSPDSGRRTDPGTFVKQA
jgi:cytoskeletal protein CcmA (bactofilin family)